MSKLKRIYVCSPYKGDVETNVRNAVNFSRCITMLGAMPITPQIYFTQFVNDDIPMERQIGLAMGIDLLSECDEMWVFGIENPSSGMQGEIEYAQKHNIPVQDGYRKIASAIVDVYCEQHNILSPSITAPIFYFASLAYCEDKIRNFEAYAEIVNTVAELNKSLPY